MTRTQIRVLALAMLMALSAVLPAPAQRFEGVVTIRTVTLTSDIVAEQTGEQELSDRGRDKLFAMSLDQLVQIAGSANTSAMQIKGGRIRTAAMDMPGLGSAYILMETATGVMRTVSPGKRGYYEASLRGADGSGDEEEAPTVEPLGRTQVVNGLRCTGYRVTRSGEISRVWTTDDAGVRDVLMSQLRMVGEDNAGSRTARALLGRYGAAVMSQTFDEEGDFRVEVWSFERKTLPDSLFVVPAGFSKLRMPGG